MKRIMQGVGILVVACGWLYPISVIIRILSFGELVVQFPLFAIGFGLLIWIFSLTIFGVELFKNAGQIADWFKEHRG